MSSVEKSILVVIDVQGKLAQLMHEKDKLFKNIQILIQTAHYLNIPILYTEQVPQKMGITTPEIFALLKNSPITKKTFSACLQPEFLKQLKTLKRKQIIICGIESHICVYQTVVDLLNLKYEVQVVADGVSSRTLENKQLGLERMKEERAILTTTEMILYELLRTSEHPKFKQILELIK